MSRDVCIDHLSVSYRRAGKATHAISDISCEIPQGIVCGITGSSGCGKSTLLYVLAGIITDYEGSVRIGGEIPDPHRLSIGLVPQHYGLLPWKTAEDNILFPLRLRRQRVETDLFDSIIDGLELRALLSRFPHELSGGQCQRVALARAFVQRPDILLLDEPFSALDINTAAKSRQLFASLQQLTGVTTILVTHNIDEAIEMCDHIIVMGDSPGRIVARHDRPDAETLRTHLAGSKS